MRKWEYTIRDIERAKFDTEANALGKVGWKAINVSLTKSTYTVIFQREVD